MRKFLAGAMLLVSAIGPAIGPAMAGEEQDAQKTCERLLSQFKNEQGKKADAIDPVQQCRQNSMPLSYWNCTDERMKTGESYIFAAAQCKNKS